MVFLPTTDGVSVSSVAEQLVSKAAMLVRIDDDKDVVMAALEGLSLLLKEVGSQFSTSSSIREKVISCVRDVFNSRVCYIFIYFVNFY